MRLCLVLFHSVGVWEFKIAVSKKAIATKIKVYFEIGDIALAVENLWPLGRIIGVKPNKKDRVVRRVGPKFRSLGHGKPHRQGRSSRGFSTPREH